MTQGKCCGVQSPAAAREKRGKRTYGQLKWIGQKLMVVITIGIMAYAAYVYIGRLCVPMIRRRSDAGADRGTGLALLLVFAVLYLWLVWAYIKVVITSPGYAKDYVPISERPLVPTNVAVNPTTTPNPDTDLELGRRDQSLSQPKKTERGLAGPSYEDLTKRDASIVGIRGVDKPNLGPDADIESNPLTNVTRRPSITVSTSETQPSNTFKPAFPSTAVLSSSPNDRPHLAVENNLKLPKWKSRTSDTSASKHLRKAQLMEAQLQRLPPTTPVLLPLHRYCLTEGIVKPYRAHHCRSCGTCVLKYDHHCPWIGQCVGARNHKFFINFCLSTLVFAAFVLATLIPFVVLINKNGDLDVQKLVVIGLAGFFLLFSFTMLINHVLMILTGMTTVETMQMSSMEHRETLLLGKFYSWWEFGAKAQKRREWDKEWGALSTEGNIWWKGDRHAEWVDVMGVSWLGWIFPFGRGLSDGLIYPVNQRFDREGRWRRRSDWPEELR